MAASIGLVLACANPNQLARFWSEAIGYAVCEARRWGGVSHASRTIVIGMSFGSLRISTVNESSV